MDRTTKTVWYKRANIAGERQSLQALLSSALSDRPKAGSRLMSFGDDSEKIGINLYQTRRDLLFGQFLSFQPGMRQPVMTFDDDKTAFDLATIAAESGDDGKRREFLESIGYFGIVDNHLLLVQTKVLASREFEEYLSWLLIEATGKVPRSTMITLDDPAATSARKKSARRNVRGVTIGTQLKAVARAERDDGESVTKFDLSGGGFDALRNLLGADIFNKLSLEESLEEDKIELQLTVRMKGRRVASDGGQRFLRAVGRATRHMDPRDYSLELDRNGELQGSDLKLHRVVNVATQTEGGLIDESGMMTKMLTWLAELNKAGLIDP